jgi:hypothetical protein
MCIKNISTSLLAIIVLLIHSESVFADMSSYVVSQVTFEHLYNKWIYKYKIINKISSYYFIIDFVLTTGPDASQDGFSKLREGWGLAASDNYSNMTVWSTNVLYSVPPGKSITFSFASPLAPVHKRYTIRGLPASAKPRNFDDESDAIEVVGEVLSPGGPTADELCNIIP